MSYNVDAELKEAILEAVVNHGKKSDKVMTKFAISWKKIDGAQCVSGYSVRYKLGPIKKSK